MKAITTEYIGPSNYLGPRIKASAGNLSVTIPYPYEINESEDHKAAMIELCHKLEWIGFTWVQGITETGYVFVQIIDLFTV